MMSRRRPDHLGVRRCGGQRQRRRELPSLGLSPE